MATQGEYKLNVSPTQLMVFAFATVVLVMGMVYVITSMVLNSQTAQAQAGQSNTSGNQYLLSKDGVAGTCSEPADTNSDAEHAVGSTVSVGGEVYRVVGVYPTNGTQINEDNDTVTTIDNRNSGNTTIDRRTDNRNSGNTAVDNRNSGNTSTDNRNSGNTAVDNRNSGNTTTTSDNRNQGNTNVDIHNNGNSPVDNRNSGNTTTTTDNRDQGNTNNQNNGNTSNSGNSNAQNNGNSVHTEDNDTTITRRVVTNHSLF